MEHTGTIVFCSREDHVEPSFTAQLARLMQLHPHAKLLPMVGNNIADSRNQAVMQAEGDWIWYIDTDMVFDPSTIDRLLARNVDVVQALCLKRHPPHEPVMWEHDPARQNATPGGPPGLREVVSLGAGGTLYRRRVFEAIQGPWFEGILGTEDTNFAQKIRKAGFTLYVDTAVPVGHITPMIISPVWDGSRWAVEYKAMNGQTLLVHVSKVALPKAEEVRAYA